MMSGQASAPITENASLELAQARYLVAAIGIITDTFKTDGAGPAVCRFLRETVEICSKFDLSLVFPSHARDLEAICEEARCAVLEHFGTVLARDRIEVGISAARSLLGALGQAKQELDDTSLTLMRDRIDHVSALVMLIDVAVIDARIISRGDLHRKSQGGTLSQSKLH